MSEREEEKRDKEGWVEVELELNEDFSKRIRITGPTSDVITVTKSILIESEREGYRRQFFSAAHWIVFSVAGLSVVGMVAHFLNIWKFDTRFLALFGVWTVGSIIYLYLVIVRDVFGVKAKIPKPPKVG